jgi:hypothetical protein
MIQHRLNIVGAMLTAALIFTGAASQAFGDAVTDIQVLVTDGKLSTNLSKFVGTFDPGTFETHDPGFAGSPPQGQAYGVQVAQKLWYHSGIEGDPVTAVPGGVSVSIADGTTTLNVSGTSGLQSGLILTGSLSGSLHAHLDFSLSPGTAPDGVYGLVLQITSPSFQSSDPFLLAIANIAGGGLTLEGIEYGEQAIFDAVAVPEPSSVVLAGLGAAGALAAGWRRRRQTGAANSAFAEAAR